MQSSIGVEADLRDLAEHLSSRRDAVLTAVRTAAREDPRLTAGAKLPRVDFIDHLPQLLDAFGARLRARTARDERQSARYEIEAAAEHGRHRWQQGYNLTETILEWRHLHACLLEEIERFAAQRAVSAQSFGAAVRELAALLGEGVCQSAQQHAQLHQAESAGRAFELSQALEKIRAIETDRANTWREALHDLRGGVGLVRNASALIVTEPAADPLQQDSREFLRRGVTSLTELLEELLSLARLEAGQEQVNVARFDVAQALRSLCAASRPLAASRGLFLKADGPQELFVAGDTAKIQRIAQNLLLNALKYTETGGVWLRWEPAGGPRDADGWALVVQDTGPGLAAPMALHPLGAGTHAVVDGAGEPRAHPAGTPPVQRGEGIGLSIVKRLCELLDGRIELDTAPGQGTTFRVTFPGTHRA